MRGSRAAHIPFCEKLMTIETESKNLNKAERVEFVLQRLQELYPNPPIPLDHKDPYTLLVAVLLSAQCTDERVNLVTPGLWELADNPYDMMKVPVNEIQEAIRSCGLEIGRAHSELQSRRHLVCRLLLEKK